MTWTQFWDMHSGGNAKTDYEMIFIEAPEREAIGVFISRFNQHPLTVSCPCCGGNFSVREFESLEDATAYHRNCRYDSKLGKYVEEPDERFSKKHTPLAEYVKRKEMCVIRKEDIKEGERERHGEPGGYEWCDEEI